MLKLKLILACGVFVCLLPAAVGAQQTYELRCRGVYAGPTPLTFDNQTGRQGDGTLVVAMRFRASPRAAGADGSGLEPGTCAWIDRPLNSAEPRLLWFVAQEYPNPNANDPLLAERVPSKGAMTLYLYEAERYWSFFAYNTGQGHLRATSHRYWKPLRSRAATTSRSGTVTRPR
jgi:hypothetical protein